jgi:NADH dehydrogenase
MDMNATYKAMEVPRPGEFSEVAASPIPKMLGTKTDRAGRALVDPFLKVVDRPRVFVVGDAASVLQNEHPVPGVAQAAIQEGQYVGRLIAKELKGQKIKRPFRYFDKGNMAVVGKNYAVLERDWLRTSGFLTWLVWAFVHILSLPRLQNRLRVQQQWLWSYFTGQRSSRLIPEPPEDRMSKARSTNGSAITAA